MAKRSVVRMTFRYPSFEEMRALENAARSARAKEMRRLLGSAVAFVRHTLSPSRKGLRHA